MPDRFHPSAVAQAYREEHPGRFDAFDDKDLLDAIRESDPDTYKLVDPVLLGAEVLGETRPGRSQPKPTFPTVAPPPKPKVLPAAASAAPGVVSTGMRVVPAVVGGVIGSAGGPLGTAVGGAVGAGGGEWLAQNYEQRQGLREDLSPMVMASEAALGAIPFSRFATLGRAGRVGMAAGQGALLSTASQGARDYLEGGEVGDLSSLGPAALLGGAFGGAVGGGIEVGGAYRAAQQATIAAAQKEALIADATRRLTETFGPAAAVGVRDRSLKDLGKGKTYLDEIAALQAPVVPIPPVDPTLVGAPPPRPQGLLPERAGPSIPGYQAPETILAARPGVDPNLIEAPRGRRVVSNEPPPTALEAQLEASLQTPPGQPRLVAGTQPPALGLTMPAAPPPVPGGVQGQLLPPPIPGGPIRQTGRVGGAPPDPSQPRLPEVLRPRPVERNYPEGTNLNPRRKGELHGEPRILKRQLRVGGQTRVEMAKTKVPAEDPGMYAPEVRREIARIVQEMEDFPWSREPSGVTKAMMEEFGGDVAEIRRKKASAGGAIAGAPVYHEIIEAAQGSRAHATRAEVVADLRAAILEGKGSALSDAAAIVARGRIAQEATPPLRGQKLKHTTRSPRGAGDALIGWVDEAGDRALPDLDLPVEAAAARELSDGEVQQTLKMIDEMGGVETVGPEASAWFQAAVKEAERRGLRVPQQPQLELPASGGAAAQEAMVGAPPPAAPPAPRRPPTAEAGFPPLDLELLSAPPKPKPSNRLTTTARSSERRLDPATRAQFDEIVDELYAGQVGASREQMAEAARRNPPRGTALEAELDANAARARAILRDEPLPGLAGVRGEARAMPPVAEAPFSLTAPVPPSMTKRAQQTFWERMKREEGVLVLDIPAGDRTGLKRWLGKQEAEHGGEGWYSRAEEALEAGDWDRAWKIAAAASASSYGKAWRLAKTPQERTLVEQAVRGTPLQEDVNTQIIGQARGREGIGGPPAPTVKGMPTSPRVTQAGADRSKARVGPAGILDPGAPQRPLTPQQRSHTLPRTFVDTVLEETDADLIHVVPGNRDSRLRLYRQVAELAFLGKNTREVKHYLSLSNEEIAQHYRESVQEAARLLQGLSAYAQANRATLTAAAEQMSFGGALRGVLGKATGGRISGGVTAPPESVVGKLVEDSAAYDELMLLHTLQKPQKLSMLEAIHNASYSWMLSLPATAVRNIVSTTGRYTVDALDEALTAGISKLVGDTPGAARAGAQAREMARSGLKGSAMVTPRTSWRGTLQEIYDYTAAGLQSLSPADARRTISLLSAIPEREAHFLGAALGEQLAEGTTGNRVVDALIDPKLQRMLTTFNRAQEFSGRGMVFDASVRAQVRAKGLDPDALLQLPTPEIVSAVGGPQAFDDLLYVATTAALESTFSGQAARQSIPGALLSFVNQAWPLKLGFPFPKFNLIAAPRWIYDHSPAALAELIRFPLDVTGVTGGGFKGGRLYRGYRASKLQTETIPQLLVDKAQTAQRFGSVQRELVATAREHGAATRRVTRLQKRSQAGLPGTATALEQAIDTRDQLGRRRQRLQGTLTELKGRVREIDKTERHFRDVVRDAQGINAPTAAQYLARMTTGTAILGAAAVIRSQVGQEGTRWYEYRIDRGEGQDPEILDLRAYAPFAQYLYVADVMQDLSRHTNWDAAREDADEMGWTSAIWNNYEGKYTADELGAEFGKAFLSISRAAGTSLTLADLLTQNGWPSLNDATNAVIGTVGQFLSRFTTPARLPKDLLASVSPEEAKVRIPPAVSATQPYGPLSAPLANVPGASRLIPESIAQTSGKPMTTAHPFLRALAGIGSAPRDFVVEEIRRVGVPGRSVYIRETGDPGVDKLMGETYGRILQQYLPRFLEHADYTRLTTPAQQRDFLQRDAFPLLKQTAIDEVRAALGEDRWQEASVQGEARRRQTREGRLLEQLEQETGYVEPEVSEADDALVGTPPPTPAAAP